jgi:DNA-binding GntR family transcriptional regulator
MNDPGKLKAIRTQESLTDQIRESIRTAILDGELEPGTLYSVQTLADTYEVSRTPVREALIDLSRQGMVSFERNRGVRILESSPQDLEEILELRVTLEVPATRRAASEISDPEIERLGVELEKMEAAARDDDEAVMMAHDRRFHEILNDAAGNERLAAYVDSLRDLILTRGVSTVGRSRSLDEIIDEHREIHRAIVARDPKAAARAMRDHLVNTSTLLLEQEGGDPSGPKAWAKLVRG